MTKRRAKKVLIVTVIVIAVFVALVIVFVSPFTKYLIKKYDEKYTGRQVDMDWVYVNPFTGYVHIRNFQVFEYKSNNIFFSARGVSVNVNLRELLNKVYEVSSFTLSSPRIRIIQDGTKFNFSDMLTKFSPGKKTESEEPVRFSIKNISIKNGEFYYIDRQVPLNYFIRSVTFDSKGKKWDTDTISGSYSLLSGPGSGSIKGDFYFNTRNKDYRIATIVDKFDMKLMEQYMKELANYGQLSATLDASLKMSGNMNDSMSLTTKGRIAINNLHFGKNINDDYVSFDKLILKFVELNLKKGSRVIDSVMLVHPVVKYERYDELDNIQRMFGENGSKIDSVKADPQKFNLVLKLTDFIKMLSETFTKDYFKINKFAIQDANLQFNDYSLTEKFSMALSPFTVTADSIDKNKDRIIIQIKTLIKPYGEASAQISINPKNKGYFDLNYKFQKIPVTLFNPYLISYTSFPLDRGTIELHGNWNVTDSVIKSENHLIMIDPRVTKRVRKKDAKWIPMPLVMSFIRERGNVIDYKIPVEGNLKDPDFKFKDVISDLLKNIFVKPPSSPYIFEVKNIENEVEKSLSLKWTMRVAKLLPHQEKFVKNMADFLRENPEASVTINPLQYAVKEKEHILLFEAKKKYYLGKNNIKSLSDQDSVNVEKMSVKDPAFVKYLDRYVKDSSLFTIQQKCMVYVGNHLVKDKYYGLLRSREKEFLKYFRENGTDKQVKILADHNSIPFNGYSYYKVTYKGDIPDELREAYQKMEELNRESPRKQYKRWR